MLILEGFCEDGSALSWAPCLLGELGPLGLLGLMGSPRPTSYHLFSLLLLPQMGQTSFTSASDPLHYMPLPGCSPPSTLGVHPLTSLSSQHHLPSQASPDCLTHVQGASHPTWMCFILSFLPLPSSLHLSFLSDFDKICQLFVIIEISAPTL